VQCLRHKPRLREGPRRVPPWLETRASRSRPDLDLETPARNCRRSEQPIIALDGEPDVRRRDARSAAGGRSA